MCKADNYTIERARGTETHFIEKIPCAGYNNRFLSYQTRYGNPDFLYYMLERAKGEFSINTDLAFGKHLKQLEAKAK